MPVAPPARRPQQLQEQQAPRMPLLMLSPGVCSLCPSDWHLSFFSSLTSLSSLLVSASLSFSHPCGSRLHFSLVLLVFDALFLLILLDGLNLLLFLFLLALPLHRCQMITILFATRPFSLVLLGPSLLIVEATLMLTEIQEAVAWASVVEEGEYPSPGCSACLSR